ncbi:MAG: flagellar basal body P-ring protein FlgI [Planctomycetota bacterium]|jgi:flagellar P-ring protein precursor FlgI
MKTLTRALAISLLTCAVPAQEQKPLFKVEINNITKIHGTMNNRVQGFGLVTGLKGQGAGGGVSRQALANAIRRSGLNVTESQLSSGNVAIVSVTAVIPPFSHVGQEVPVQVQVVTDATSLEGGMLLQTELKFMDQAESVVYVTASGTISTGGISAIGSNATLTVNNPTTGVIPNGGNVIRAVPTDYLTEDGNLELLIKDPSLRTANNIVRRINTVLDQTGFQAMIIDPALVRITLPQAHKNKDTAIEILSQIGKERVEVHHPSKVVINTNTLTVIAGRGVQISPCVVNVGGLTVSVIEDEEVSQPLPGYNKGTTEIVNRTSIEVIRKSNDLKGLTNGGATVDELMGNLKALDLNPLELIEVFKALDDGGFLHAPLVVN